MKISFKATIWKSEGKGAWYFVTLPKKDTLKIRQTFQEDEEGWGRLKVEAQIASETWSTAIWFDSKADSYLLPIKSEIRKRHKLDYGVQVMVSILV